VGKRVAGLLFPMLIAAGCAEPAHVERTWTVLGAPLRVELYMTGEQEAELAFADIRTHIETVEAVMGPGPGTELARLNTEAREDFYEVQDADFYRLLRLALDYAQVTRGAFDPTLAPLMRLYQRGPGRGPGPTELERVLGQVGWDKVTVAPEARAIGFRNPGVELDLGGVAKGFALDIAARAFARPGVLGGVVQLGGNFYTWGEAPGRKAWVIDVPDPRVTGRDLLRVGLTNRGVAVSGHTAAADGSRVLLDPLDGRPASSDLIAAVGIADSGADADALSTALFVAGSMRGSELLLKLRRVEAVLVVRGEDGIPYVLASASLRGRLELSASLAAETEGQVRFLLPPEAL